MFEIRYKINHTSQFAADVFASVGADFDKTATVNVVDNHIFKSEIETHQLTEGLSIQLSYFLNKEDMKVSRLGTDDEDLLILDFHVKGDGSLDVMGEDILKKPISALNYGAYFAHSRVESYAIFPPLHQNEEIHFVISRKWLLQTFQLDEKELGFSMQNPFFMYENLSPVIIQTLQQISFSDAKMKFRKSFLLGKSLVVLSYFLDSLIHRKDKINYPISNYDEVQKVFNLVEYISKNLNTDLSVQSLAQKIGFSESKLQKLFKSIFGRSVARQVQEIKMQTALELLSEKKYSVAEVGHQLGYENMSHFARVFKKTHGILPSNYLKNR